MSEKTGTVKVTETLKVIMNGADEEKWREFTDPEEAGRWLMDEATGNTGLSVGEGKKALGIMAVGEKAEMETNGNIIMKIRNKSYLEHASFDIWERTLMELYHHVHDIKVSKKEKLFIKLTVAEEGAEIDFQKETRQIKKL